MEELVQAVNGLKGTVLDDLIVLVPSVVAILISICTARKQNQIALFEKRYEVYAQVERIRSVGRKLQEQLADAKGVLDAESMLTGAVVTMGWEQGGPEVIHAQRIHMESLLCQAQFLYPRFPMGPLQQLMDEFKAYLNLILGSKKGVRVNDEVLQGFVQACGAGGAAEKAAGAMQAHLKLGGRIYGAPFRK